MVSNKVDLSKIPAHFVGDVEEFFDENRKYGRMEDLSPEQFFRFYLEWNGISGLSDSLIQLLEALGWRRA
jgi:hypothetical protein